MFSQERASTSLQIPTVLKGHQNPKEMRTLDLDSEEPSLGRVTQPDTVLVPAVWMPVSSSELCRWWTDSFTGQVHVGGFKARKAAAQGQSLTRELKIHQLQVWPTRTTSGPWMSAFHYICLFISSFDLMPEVRQGFIMNEHLTKFVVVIYSLLEKGITWVTTNPSYFWVKFY
jgi:hypothetical protein